MKCVICKKERYDIVPASLLYKKVEAYDKFVCRRCLYQYVAREVITGDPFGIVRRRVTAWCEKNKLDFITVVSSIFRKASRKCKVTVFMAHESQIRGWAWHSTLYNEVDRIVASSFCSKNEAKAEEVIRWEGNFSGDPSCRFAIWGGNIYLHNGSVKFIWNVEAKDWRVIMKCPCPAFMFANTLKWEDVVKIVPNVSKPLDDDDVADLEAEGAQTLEVLPQEFTIPLSIGTPLVSKVMPAVLDYGPMEGVEPANPKEAMAYLVNKTVAIIGVENKDGKYRLSYRAGTEGAYKWYTFATCSSLLQKKHTCFASASLMYLKPQGMIRVVSGAYGCCHHSYDELGWLK